MKKENQIQTASLQTDIPAENSSQNSHREMLKLFSKDAMELVRSGKYTSINQALIQEFYQRFKDQPFKTVEEWNDLGFKIKQGEKAYLLWGKQINVPATANKEAYKFFPIKLVFNNDQVEPVRKEVQA